MLHIVLWVFVRNSCLFLAGQYPSEFQDACCVVGACKQLFVSSWSIPIRMLCCMLCCGYLQIAVCFQPVNTHPNSVLHVVLWAVARNGRLFLAGQYPSEFYVACCVVGLCKKQLFVSSRSIPIRILCCMLCCGQLQEMAVCLKPVNTHPNCILHVVLWVSARHLLFVSNRPITIRILCCMLCFGYLHRNSCLFLAGQYPSEFYVACCVVGGYKKQLFVLAGQYPSEFYVACCVLGICKQQLFVSSRSIPI